MMKTILFDNIIYSLQQSGGISSMWTMLLNSFYQDNRFDYTCFESNKKVFQNIYRKDLSIDKSKILIHKSILPLSIERYLDINVPNSDIFSIFHSSYYRVLQNKSIKSIVTVHDFTYERFMSGIKKQIHCHQKYKAINNADFIVCVSNNTYNDLLYYLPEINKNKVKVIYNGVSSDFHHIENIEKDDYLLYVGSRCNYKNFNLLIEALSETSHRIKICGTPLSNKEEQFLNKKIGHNRYEIYSNINNAQLNQLYNSSKCLIYPSSYEGFGLPILEAQSANCPVIALNTSSIPEVIGKSPLLIKNADKKSLIKALNMLEQDSILEEVINAGQANVKRFSHETMANQYKDLYLNL